MDNPEVARATNDEVDVHKDDIDTLTESPETEQIYTYQCDFQNNAIAFRNKKDNKFQVAIASYETESMNNKVEIVDLSL